MPPLTRPIIDLLDRVAETMATNAEGAERAGLAGDARRWRTARGDVVRARDMLSSIAAAHATATATDDDRTRARALHDETRSVAEQRSVKAELIARERGLDWGHLLDLLEPTDRIRSGDAAATQALWRLRLHARLMLRFGAYDVARFSPQDLAQLHPLRVSGGEIVLGFELLDDLRPRRDLAAVDALLGKEGWARAAWWCVPSTWLDGAVLIELMDQPGGPERVLDAARRAGRAGPLW